VSAKGLVAVAAGGLTNLTHLDLSGCSNYKDSLSENGVIALARGLPSLAYLDIKGCKGVRGNAPAAMAALTGLTRLDMTVPEYMGDESLRSLTGLTALKRLHWSCVV
jgi:hypothetical protein